MCKRLGMGSWKSKKNCLKNELQKKQNFVEENVLLVHYMAQYK